MGSSLEVKVTSDIVDLQAKMAVAKAEVQSYAAEMRNLAQQISSGAIGTQSAELQQVTEDFLHAKEKAAELAEQMKGVREAGGGVGEALEDIHGKISTAFEVTGIAAAYEAIKSVAEAIEQIGEEAVKVRSMSDVLGVSTDQFQAMQHAAEDAGVGEEQLTHAGERLVSILTEARNGTGSAIEKLLQLGVSAEQVHDPAFQLNDLLQVLHERLESAGTKQETMNALIVALGSRAALAAEAIKEYDGSVEGVARVMERLNGLTDDQIDRLAKSKAAVNEATTSWKNYFLQLLLGSEQMDTKGMNALTMSNIGSPQQAQSSVASMNPLSGLAEQASATADEIAAQLSRASKEAEAAHTSAINKAKQEELELAKSSIEIYEKGTEQRIEAAKHYAEVAQEVYGSSDVDAVRKANAGVREALQERTQALLQAGEQYNSMLEQQVHDKEHHIQQEMEADNEYLQERKKMMDKIDNMEEFGLDLSAKVAKDKSKVAQEALRLQLEQARELQQQWRFLTDGMRAGFDQALHGILSGTETFGDAMRGMFTSVLDAIIGKLADWAAEWVTKLLIAKFTNQATAASQISANAGIAATAAMASVAAIPFVGWAMAPEVGAATFGEAMAYEGSTAVAEGGWDVPSSARPMPALLHSEEMVLPRPLANVVRRAAGDGGDQQAPRSLGSLNIKFTPVQGGYGLIHMGNLAEALKQINRRFALG